MQNIVIKAKGTIASVGHHREQIWQQYKSQTPALSICCFNDQDTPTGRLSQESEELLHLLRKEKISYRRLDKSVLLGLWAARKALEKTGWKELKNTGVNMGSSRGATQLFEKYHQHFIETPNKRMSPLVSPTTTLGNIASWLAYDLGVEGVSLSHSITCSTALHGILNACAWLNSEMADQFLVGGAEAPLTDFTLAQMRALGIYSKQTTAWPCAPLQTGNQENKMVLGEGASVFALEKNKGQKGLATIIGLGYATEIIEHNASLSADAECLQKSMNMALKDAELTSVDVVVMHAPGTLQGDQSELSAIQAVFGKEMPQLISTKHQTGHSLGASGALSLDLAIEMIVREESISFPYPTEVNQKKIAPKTVLINAVGFGGNAVSIIIQKKED